MSYLERLNHDYPNSHSKKESLAILARYKNKLDAKQYEAIRDSLCSHSLEEIYLNERDILLSIAQLKDEITIDEIVEIAKVI